MSLSVKLTAGKITYDQPIGLYIDGKWVTGKEGKTFETINPSNEKPICSVHEAGPEGKPHGITYIWRECEDDLTPR